MMRASSVERYATETSMVSFMWAVTSLWKHWGEGEGYWPIVTVDLLGTLERL